MSSDPTESQKPADAWWWRNLPNLLTLSRIFLAVVLFAVLSFPNPVTYLIGLVIFVLAAVTDFLDGYLARRFHLVTQLGRILDPFADKLVVCGTFVFLAASPRMLETPWGLHPWIVVVILARELLITGLRSFLEERRIDFSARWSGKIKMALQCVLAVVAFAYLAFDQNPPGSPLWCWMTLVVLTYATLLVTVYSGYRYVRIAAAHLREIC
ncbi:MAG: CDP-diacylglycerol--glycerol-3-phosphate 3-phosphatidyltransferase [Thermogutta sp.]|nr:CDP-diacylglycerol--glycerol-3-phosphate 3-phosphatidyltransferase [Thermogutta sp.]